MNMHWNGHPDDEPSPRFGGWADDFNTFDEACQFYGCDTPAQIEAEAKYRDEESWIEQQDKIEACGPQFYVFRDEIAF